MNFVMPQEAEIQKRLTDARRVILERTARQRRRRIAWRFGVGGVAFFVAGTSIAATAVLWRANTEEVRTSVVCYQHDDLRSLTSTTAGSEGVDPTGQTVKAATINPIESCSNAWKAGLGVVDGPHGRWPANPQALNLSVPPMSFCVLNSGLTAGFPIEEPSSDVADVCERLGLARWHAKE